MKTLDDAVIELNGALPSCIKNKFNTENGWYISTKGKLAHSESCVWFDMIDFQQRAKELGFVGKYRWGVLYKTDGTPPELPNDVVIGVADYPDAPFSAWKWEMIDSFKIIDHRYKPADTSYLDNSGGIERLGVDDHFDMSEFKCQFNRLPEQMKSALKQSFDDWFNSEVSSRKAKAERKRVVDAAYNAIAKPNGIGVDAAIVELYDKGFLRLPENKK